MARLRFVEDSGKWSEISSCVVTMPIVAVVNSGSASWPRVRRWPFGSSRWRWFAVVLAVFVQFREGQYRYLGSNAPFWSFSVDVEA